MNKLAQALSNYTTTANGAAAVRSTLNANLDLFSKIGSMRMATDDAVLAQFSAAFEEDPDLALRVLLWARDCRGGAGERKVSRTILKALDVEFPNSILMAIVIDRLVEVGRWDDIFLLENNFYNVMNKIVEGIEKKDNLLLKWLPREKSANGRLARKIADILTLTPKQYRKLCSGFVTTETLMCARKWQEINLSQVPSKASSIYQKAFQKNCPQYEDWKAALVTGEAKINMSVAFPYDVYKMIPRADATVVNAAWNALPNYIAEGVSILPIVDVSGSMSCPASQGLTCMDVAIGLGAYIAQKNTGPFKDMMITFHSNPTFHKMGTETIDKELRNIAQLPWGGSTNFQRTYELILDHCIKVHATQADLPQYLICLSDMQFNVAEGCYGVSRPGTNLEVMRKKFKQYGYEMPKLVFWNLNGDYNNQPATKDDSNVIMVSGFSPSILKTILSGKEVTPFLAMLDTINVDRYKVL